jgi:hypothetical protein
MPENKLLASVRKLLPKPGNQKLSSVAFAQWCISEELELAVTDETADLDSRY